MQLLRSVFCHQIPSAVFTFICCLKNHQSQKIEAIVSLVELAILDPGCFQDLVTVSDLRL